MPPLPPRSDLCNQSAIEPIVKSHQLFDTLPMVFMLYMSSRHEFGLTYGRPQLRQNVSPHMPRVAPRHAEQPAVEGSGSLDLG